VDGDTSLKVGAIVGLRFAAKWLHFFDDGGTALMV